MQLVLYNDVAAAYMTYVYSFVIYGLRTDRRYEFLEQHEEKKKKYFELRSLPLYLCACIT